MEKVTEGVLGVFSQFIFPIIIVFISGAISVAIKTYESLNEKNNYIKILKTHSPFIKSYLDDINNYKIWTVYLNSFIILFTGVLFGIIIEIHLADIWFAWMVSIGEAGYLREMYPKFILEDISLFKLNINVNRTSFLGLAFVIITGIFTIWFKFIQSRNLLIPQFGNGHIIKNRSKFVYFSYWFFIGTIIGVNIIIFACIYSTIRLCLPSNENFSFTWMYFTNIYTYFKTNVVYSEIYILEPFGFLFLSLFMISILFDKITMFSNNVIESITNFYKSDFPEVKIKTEYNEVKGQLNDIINKSSVTLSEKNELKIVQWDKIVIMEVSCINKNEQLINQKAIETPVKKKKSLWKFW